MRVVGSLPVMTLNRSVSKCTAGCLKSAYNVMRGSIGIISSKSNLLSFWCSV